MYVQLLVWSIFKSFDIAVGNIFANHPVVIPRWHISQQTLSERNQMCKDTQWLELQRENCRVYLFAKLHLNHSLFTNNIYWTKFNQEQSRTYFINYTYIFSYKLRELRFASSKYIKPILKTIQIIHNCPIIVEKP